MKLADLFALKRRQPPNDIDPRGHAVAEDRSSMAELVRLLREFDDTQKGASQLGVARSEARSVRR